MAWRNKLARFIGLEAALTNIDPGKIAPDFSLKGLDGKELSLSSLLQRGPVVVAFFKISCPVCQFTFPFLQRIFERFEGKDVSVIGISQDDPISTKEFNREFGVKFPVLLSLRVKLHRFFSIPTVIRLPMPTGLPTCRQFS
jgi:peroxiredoxin